MPPQRPATATSLPHARGLDGVRALAVAAVVAYHLGTTSGWNVLSGGFLGVDVFFVLSGYLITSLLIVEVRRRGTISVGRFYLRRARRLLPALFTVLLVVGLVGAFWLPELAARIRGDLYAALGYATNWWLIAQNSSYFSTAGDRPDLLTHLWSLAVEEQFYLVWPVLMIIFAALRIRRVPMVVLILAGVAASTVAGALLYDPYSDPSRVYYGTDTRALAPLLGAALAVATMPWLHRRDIGAWRRTGLDVVGLASLAGLAYIAVRAHDTDPLLYRGGLLVIAIAAAGLVGVAGHPATLVGRVLGTGPLRWIGDRSYAIYLWHWPLFVLTRPGIDIPLVGWQSTAARVAAVLLLAEASYWLIERPVRRYGFLGLRRTAPAKPAIAPASALADVTVTLTPSPLSLRTRDTTVDLRAPGFSNEPTVVLATAGASRGNLARTLTRPPGTTRRTRHVLHAAALVLILAGGTTLIVLNLPAAAARPVAGGPVDPGPAATLGPLTPTTPVPSVTGSPVTGVEPKRVPNGTTVAFFGDSQGMTLLLNKPADLASYIRTYDETISGCGILLGKVTSRTGERRDLTSNCRNWQPEWASRVQKVHPGVSVIMIGAWDVFDLKLESGTTLTFASAGWDANFSATMKTAVDTLRPRSGEVAVSLLPCYRPIKASAGYWPERGDDTRTRHVNDLIRAVVAKYADPAVRTLDPPSQFCTDPSIGRNTSYRWDGVHFYKKGAALYFEAVLPQLLISP